MKPLYRSKKGEIGDYNYWDRVADRFYKDVSTWDFLVVKPSDWFERWTKILGLEVL